MQLKGLIIVQSCEENVFKNKISIEPQNWQTKRIVKFLKI